MTDGTALGGAGRAESQGTGRVPRKSEEIEVRDLRVNDVITSAAEGARLVRVDCLERVDDSGHLLVTTTPINARMEEDGRSLCQGYCGLAKVLRVVGYSAASKRGSHRAGCPPAARQAEAEECDECHELIPASEPSMISARHSEACSLHPNNVVG